MSGPKPGSYNSRVDSLSTAWRKVFGFTHGLLLVDAFFENVKRDGQNVVLRFDPTPPQQMQVACLWTRTEIPGATTYGRSRQSPTTHRRKWRQPATTDASEYY